VRTLVEAYENTTFRIECPEGGVSLRPRSHSSALDQILAKNKWQYAAVITAFNPKSIEKTREQNELANRRLERKIISDGYIFFPGAGAGDDLNWLPEDSYLILDIALKQALEIAEEFGQYAIAFHTLGQKTAIELTAIGSGSLQNPSKK
jgi:hypothetical protein